MIEKKIRGFYNSVQITGDFSKECEEKIDRLRLIVRACLGFGAAVVLARAVMCLVDVIGQEVAGEAAD